MHDLTVSKRIQQLASFLPDGARFADIGSDHAYLPCYTCLRDESAFAIAGEVKQGPFQRAIETVEAYQLQERIHVRLGDGLEVVSDDSLNQLVIAGMGGALITSILQAGKPKLAGIQTIIVQPNGDACDVRQWFDHNGYRIAKEILMEENGYLYEMIVAEKSEQLTDQLSNRAMYFGPLLRQERSELFLKKWQAEYAKLSRVISNMKQAKTQDVEKIAAFEKKQRWIREVLCDDKTTYNA